jgi:hypothetical protein
MEFTCAVWFEEALAHYHISETGNERYVARLLHCITKHRNSTPPQRVHFYKAGQQWVGDHVNTDFLDHLTASIDQNLWFNNLQFAGK